MSVRHRQESLRDGWGFARGCKVQEAAAQAKGADAHCKETEYQVLMNLVKAHANAVAALGNLDASEALLSAIQAAVDPRRAATRTVPRASWSY
jgi:outer membrane protein